MNAYNGRATSTTINYAEMRKEHKKIIEEENLRYIDIVKNFCKTRQESPKEPNKNVVHKHIVELQNPATNKIAITKKVSKTKKFCGFCRNNGEAPDFYESHITKNEFNIIVCPVLRNHSCELCRATGDFAHTLSHCPKASTLNGYQNVNMMIKNCKIKSNGQIKKF